MSENEIVKFHIFFQHCNTATSDHEHSPVYQVLMLMQSMLGVALAL